MSNIIEITEFNHPEFDIYARLNENQLRTYHEPHPGIFIAESPNVIERALNAGYKPISLLVDKKELSATQNAINRCGQIPVFVAESHVLAGLTGFQLTRGMLAAMRRRKHPEVADICRNSSRIAVLAKVQYSCMISGEKCFLNRFDTRSKSFFFIS